MSIEIFCCASESDQPFLKELSNQLAVQQQQGLIQLWDEGLIPLGAIADKEIQKHLTSARIFLLLISPDFLVDNYCSKVVMTAALKRHARGDAITIPVIVRPSGVQNVPVLKDIQVLPRNGPPIGTLPDKEQEQAFWKVAREIEGTIEALRETPVEQDNIVPPNPGPTSPPLPNPPTTILMRFLKFMFARRLGWTLIGILLLLTGGLWGFSSPTVPYMETPEGSTPLQVIPTKSGDIYIYAIEDMSTFFILRHNDFSSPLDYGKIPPRTKLAFLARSDTISVNDKIRDDTTGRDLLVTQAHVIEKLEVSDQSGISRTTYKANDYNLNGYYESRWWPIAIALIAAGLLIASVTLFVRRRRREEA